jgi:transcription elongation factor GreB
MTLSSVPFRLRAPPVPPERLVREREREFEAVSLRQPVCLTGEFRCVMHSEIASVDMYLRDRCRQAAGVLSPGGCAGKGDLMSKAFVKETDDEDDLPDEPLAIPAGVKNYMTPQGHRRMQNELRQLLRAERPKVVETVAWAAGNGDRSENGDYIYGKRRLREIDRRIRFLSKRLESAEVVDPDRQRNRNQVFFGATVTYANRRGIEMTITIVGIDEADLDRGQVSWLSPIARALMKAHQGDIVDLRAPAGVDQIEVLAIRYGIADSEAFGRPRLLG